MLWLAAGACNPGGVLGGEEGLRECLGMGKIGSLGVSCGERPDSFRGARESKNPHGSGAGLWPVAGLRRDAARGSLKLCTLTRHILPLCHGG